MREMMPHANRPKNWVWTPWVEWSVMRRDVFRKQAYLGDVAVRHEGVQHPERDVGEQHKGDDLAARLGLLLGAGGADPAAGLADDHTYRKLNLKTSFLHSCN